MGNEKRDVILDEPNSFQWNFSSPGSFFYSMSQSYSSKKIMGSDGVCYTFIYSLER